MKQTRRTAASVVAVLALVAGTGGVAVAADPLDWYTGADNVTDVDPDNLTSLKIVNAGGTEITSGTVDAALGAFAVADAAVRAGDTSASLFAHLPSSSTAAGAWSGHQVSGTTKFSGSGSVAGPTGVGSKPFVSLADSLSLSQTVDTYPNTSAPASFVGVYELRLRTSSARGGVSNGYASTYVKVAGTSWQVTEAPVLGQTGTPTPTPSATAPVATVTPNWGGNVAYGATQNVSVAVSGGSSAAKGDVALVAGSTTLASAALNGSGTASLPIAQGALRPGAHRVKVVFTSTDANVVRSATSTEHTYTVGKGTAPAPSWKVSKKVKAKKAGKLVVSVAKPAGLVQPTGKVNVVVKRGKKTTTIRNKALSGAGSVTVTVPKRKAGKWKVTVQYLGDAVYAPRTSAAKNLAVKKK